MKQFLYETVAEKEEEEKRNVKISFNIFSKPIINIPHVPFLASYIIYQSEEQSFTFPRTLIFREGRKSS